MTAYRFIHAERARWPVRAMCAALRVSRSAYYTWLRGERSTRATEDVALLVHIKAIHRRSLGTYGAPRITVELVEEGHDVGRGRVARLMREAGLTGTPKRRFRPRTTDSDHEDRVADNLLNREFTASAPNQAWVGDITYLATRSGWVYLAVLERRARRALRRRRVHPTLLQPPATSLVHRQRLAVEFEAAARTGALEAA